MKIKTSYGIALCRHNPQKNNQVEILLIKKRYSYHFFSFVYGHYKKNNDKGLKYLFDNMSFPEKIDILGMQFENMWYRIWLNNPENKFNIRNLYPKIQDESYMTDERIQELYLKNKQRFKNNFVNNGSKKLHHLIHSSTNSEILWEIPKGRKSPNETDIDCAMREFYEETLVKPDTYRVLRHIPPIIETNYDNEVEYKNVYFIANASSDNVPEPHLDFRNFKQISEVAQVKWVGLNEITFMSLNDITHNKLIQLYTTIIKKYKRGIKPSAVEL
jgi:ADP-ribose pyrophosphatase YjhB (NUDIX family)